MFTASKGSANPARSVKQRVELEGTLDEVELNRQPIPVLITTGGRN